jgi:hypothetical protein
VNCPRPKDEVGGRREDAGCRRHEADISSLEVWKTGSLKRMIHQQFTEQLNNSTSRLSFFHTSILVAVRF